jgi:hypothetical protein
MGLRLCGHQLSTIHLAHPGSELLWRRGLYRFRPFKYSRNGPPRSCRYSANSTVACKKAEFSAGSHNASPSNLYA